MEQTNNKTGQEIIGRVQEIPKVKKIRKETPSATQIIEIVNKEEEREQKPILENFKKTNTEDNKTFRYERKFIVRGQERDLVEGMVKTHPKLFSQAYEQRKINNIYFDFSGHANYQENLAGQSQRLKMRIRWYGKTFGKITKPVLELKIKEADLGRKESFTLPAFTIKKGFRTEDLQKTLLEAELPRWVKEIVRQSKATLLNAYKRKYFESHDKKFRITIDFELEFYRIRAMRNLFAEKHEEKDTVIVELKYAKELDDIAHEITEELPLRLTASSKYVFGIDVLWN